MKLARLGLLLAASALLYNSAPANAAPQRVASLGLCTDELVLLLAAPGQIATISFLGTDEEETPLARDYPPNDGSLESALAHDPDLIVTGGAVNMRAATLARRIGLTVIDLPPPQTISHLEQNIRILGEALEEKVRAAALIRWMRTMIGTKPVRQRPALSIQPGGFAGGSQGITAELLSHAGIKLQDSPEPRLDRERLLLDPRALYVRSVYRSAQFSLAQKWQPPTSSVKNVWLDGRAWTCAGPLAAIDVARLRREFAE
ncbi:MAG: hypothetical protein WA979_09455 [Pacificimonas sp.]